MKKTFVLIFIFKFALLALHAQESINISGQDAQGLEGSVSYSVGQIVNQVYVESVGIMIEGVQQPYEISSVTGTSNLKEKSFKLIAYPNPFTDIIILKIEVGLNSIDIIPDIFYRLSDINGKLLRTEKIQGYENLISMVEIAPATYFLSIISNNEVIEELKIIKK